MRFRSLLHYVPMSPLAVLPVVFAIGGAATFGHAFGLVGAVVGLLFGMVLGFGAAFAWFHFIIAKGQERERTFRDQLVEDLMTGRLRPGPRPIPPRPEVEPIPLDGPPTHTPLLPPVHIATDLPTAIANVEERAEHDLGAGLAAAEALYEARPRSGLAAGLLARLMLRAERREEACRLASDAIQMTVLAGEEEAAVQLLSAFWMERGQLYLDNATAVALAEVLQRGGEPEHARWCVDLAVAMGASEGEIERLRKRFSRP